MSLTVRLRSFVPAIVSIAFLAAGRLDAQSQEPKAVRCDAYGDPLPEGALRRLGTLRLVHPGYITAVAVSPDGKVAASGVRGGGRTPFSTPTTIRLWDTSNGKLIRQIDTPDAPVSVLHFGPDGRSLFAGCGSKVCAWDATTGKHLWGQEGVEGGHFNNGVTAERMFLVKDKLVSLHRGSLMCTVRIANGMSCYYHPQLVVRFWDSKTGQPIALPGSLESSCDDDSRILALFHDVAVSPDGRFAAVVVSQADPKPDRAILAPPGIEQWTFKDRQLKVIDLGSGKVVHTVPDAKARLYGLAFSDDGQALALRDGKDIGLVRMGKEPMEHLEADLPAIHPITLEGLPYLIPRPAFQNGDKQIAVQFYDGSVQVWDIATRKFIGKKTAKWHPSESATGGQVTAVMHGNTVGLVDARSGQPLHSFEGHRQSPLLRYALDTRDTLLSCDPSAAVRWDTRAWNARENWPIPDGALRSWWSLRNANCQMDQAISLERQLYVLSDVRPFELRELGTGKLVRKLESGPAAGDRIRPRVRFSASGNRIAAEEETLTRFYDVDTGKSLSEVPNSREGWSGSTLPTFLSPRGKIYARNEAFDHIDLFDVDTGKQMHRLVPDAGRGGEKGGFVFGFTFSPDEHWLLGEVRGWEKDRVLLWDVHAGAVIQQMAIWPDAHLPRMGGIAIEPKLGAVALSRDQRSLAVTDAGGKTIAIWETASGTKRGELPGHAAAVADLAFSPDGRQLASSSDDTTILIWDVNRPFRPGKFAATLTPRELASHWDTLRNAPADQADTAIWSLVYAAKDSVPYLKEHVKPVSRPDGQRVQRLLAALDSDDFKARSSAEEEIERFGVLVLEELSAALKQKGSLEKQRRLEHLVEQAQSAARPFGGPDRTGQWRALEVLERIGSPEAAQVLRDLAAGAGGVPLTAAARAALARLEAPASLGK